MKKYTFEVIIKEGNDEFWESLNIKGTGCDVMQETLEEAVIAYFGDNVQEVKLKKFEEE